MIKVIEGIKYVCIPLSDLEEKYEYSKDYSGCGSDYEADTQRGEECAYRELLIEYGEGD